jgi:CheY-like chemotaxis protein
MKKHTIVLVDDDADDREILRDAFLSGEAKPDYVCLENGDQLIDYLTQSSESALPSLIMLDLNMPGKDGRETLREIKSNHIFQLIPTVVFTTSSSRKDRQIVYELGANCYITKPDTFNKLVDLTNSISRLWLMEP